ncbi:glycoside hydrolase family 55 protein [Pseudomonas sp. DP-17]|uniref:glycoside hydrolase family 55 protein n=1 Tax=Pseudomonas sp. DP-17 TaxID=1580486 RepID=UPI001EFAFAB8|nr:glycoside hydrolase family 55 protein [Pseudomonas sp. DP-17]MCG8907315.1 glycoside hydrolase family 55 protein [Pseudomonas sp. DP-17]
MRYDTGNAVEPNGSSDPRDLFDNSANIDLAANGAALSWVDRKGKTRKSMAGMEADFQTALINLGYIYVGPYAAGLTLTLPNQIFDRAGEYWRAKPGIAPPLVMTGTWATDQTKVVGIGDATLRAELATTTGGLKLGYKARNVNDRLADQRSGKDDGAKGDGTTNDTGALNTAIANALPKESLQGCSWWTAGRPIRTASSSKVLVLSYRALPAVCANGTPTPITTRSP